MSGEGTGHPFVFVQQDGPQFALRPVTLGARIDDRVVVWAGLVPTDRVVTGGAILLKAATERLPAS